jgi:mono/diheme cytochrome c family protein
LVTLLLAGQISEAAANGASIFDTNCAVCHQTGGVGVPGQFPRLAGRIGTVAAKPEGRNFLSRLVLNGMAGRVTVDGDQIIGIMPNFDALPDADIASVLTYVSGLNHAPVAFTAAEVKAARRLPKLSPSDVAMERARLAGKKIIP